MAWLAEWHYYAECNLWKMAQRNKLNGKACVRLCRALFWRQFEWATALPVYLLVLAQTNKTEQKETGNLDCICVYVILNVILNQNARGKIVSLAAVFWMSRTRSPKRTAADIRTTLFSHCPCGLFAVHWTDQSHTIKSEWRKVSRDIRTHFKRPCA